MNIKKPQRFSLVEQATKEIEALIQQGYWQVGEKIPPEKVLMEKFDISRNTLREALRALSHVGLLETRQGSGTVVTSSSMFGAVVTKHMEQSTLLQIIEVRTALESEAAYLAAQRRSQQEIDKMEHYINVCETAFTKGDLAMFLEADVALHQVIVEASHNSLLIDLYATLNDSLYYSIDRNIEDLNQHTKEQHIHHQLFIAIKKQQPEKASKFVKQYLSAMKKMLDETSEV